MARAHNGGKSTRKKEQAREGAVCRGAHIVWVAPPNINEKEKSSFGVGATEACTSVSSRSRTRVGGGKEGPSMEAEGVLEGVEVDGEEQTERARLDVVLKAQNAQSAYVDVCLPVASPTCSELLRSRAARPLGPLDWKSKAHAQRWVVLYVDASERPRKATWYIRCGSDGR